MMVGVMVKGDVGEEFLSCIQILKIMFNSRLLFRLVLNTNNNKKRQINPSTIEQKTPQDFFFDWKKQ